MKLRRAGGAVGFGELQLRHPDRILIAHAHRHQPRDLVQHRIIDATPTDKPFQPVDIELGIARALIVDQHVDGVADIRCDRLRQSLGEKRRRFVCLADEIGEQITQRRQNAVV